MAHPILLPANTDFTGWTVTYEEGGSSPEEIIDTTLTVVPAGPATFCEMCSGEDDNHAAKYTIDATSVLGQGGYDASYCQHHMYAVVELLGPDAGQRWEPPTYERTVLVAFSVRGTTDEDAQKRLTDRLAPLTLSHSNPRSPIESWWIAEDERFDGSDCDSAIFVKPGCQEQAVEVLRAAGLAW